MPTHEMPLREMLGECDLANYFIIIGEYDPLLQAHIQGAYQNEGLSVAERFGIMEDMVAQDTRNRFDQLDKKNNDSSQAFTPISRRQRALEYVTAACPQLMFMCGCIPQSIVRKMRS